MADAHSDDPNIQGVRCFNELLAAEPRVSATVIQTVGSKGYDGFAIVLVTADEPAAWGGNSTTTPLSIQWPHDGDVLTQHRAARRGGGRRRRGR